MISRPLLIGVGVMLCFVLGMGFYAWRIHQHAALPEPQAANTGPLPPPVAGPTEEVTLYVAYDDPGTLRAVSARIPLPAARQQRAEEVLRALMATYLSATSPHPLASGSEIRNVYLVDPGTVVIDLNGALADGHRSGMLVEELTIASLVQTLAANVSGLLRIKFLVEGKERETLAGHADLSGFYDVSAISQMASRLSAQ
jgi:hypothetical protein